MILHSRNNINASDIIIMNIDKLFNNTISWHIVKINNLYIIIFY